MGCINSTPAQDKDYSALGKTARQVPRKGIGSTETMLSKAKTEALEETKEQALQPPELNPSGQLMEKEIKMRTKSSSSNSKMTLGTPSNAIQIEYAYWTQRGYYPDDPHKQNQDEFIITQNLATNKNDALFGIYDGHGAEGHSCARFCKKELPRLMEKQLRQQRVKRYKEQNPQTKKFFDPSKWPLLESADVEGCCKKAYMECNQNMHDNKEVPDKMSGTTATSIIFHGDTMTVCNVGDSRAVIGHRIETNTVDEEEKNDEVDEKKGDDDEEKKEEEQVNTMNGNHDGNNCDEKQQKTQLLAIPLSRDQTPYRKDERERLKKEGAVIQTIDQMEGRVEKHEDWGDLVLGKDVDIHGDPPRVWAKDKDYPGCAFTRSIGDSFSEGIGINAIPEMMSRKLTKHDEILIIASDGIFEFVTNQTAVDLCSSCKTPLEACEKLVRASYDQWLKYENRTDDITVIVCFVNCSYQPNRDEIQGTTEDLVELTEQFYGTQLRNGNKN